MWETEEGCTHFPLFAHQGLQLGGGGVKASHSGQPAQLRCHLHFVSHELQSEGREGWRVRGAFPARGG